MQELYKFLTAKCKERGVKIESLTERFNFTCSRTTIYRYMKGLLHITQDVQDRFVDLLSLSGEEQAQFARLISLSVFDETLLAARQKIDKFLFEPKINSGATREIECVFYDGDKYIRTISEIFSMIYDLSKHDDFRCDVKIIGCTQEDMLAYASDFAQTLLSLSPSSQVEHLVTLFETDFLQSTVFLLTVLPLLVRGAYKVYYRESAAGEGVKTLFGNSILIPCQYTEDGALRKRCYILSFLDKDMPECIVNDDKYVLGFWMKNYTNLRQYYPDVLTHSALSMTEDDLSTLESAYDEYLIKPNPCYNKIPMSAYRSLVSRASPDDLMRFASNMVRRDVRDDAETRAVLEPMLLDLEKRVGHTYKRRHIDVYSKEGLAEFAETGRITDHLEGLPPFDKEEIREILTWLRDRNRDPKDPYTLYLVDSLQHRYSFVIYKGRGLLVECSQSLAEKGTYVYLDIRNRNLLKVFCDYIENHLPVNYTLSTEETTAFIDELIGKNCS